MQHLPYHQIAAIDSDGRVLWTAGEIPVLDGRQLQAGRRLTDQLLDVSDIGNVVDAALRGTPAVVAVEHEGEPLRLLSAVAPGHRWVIMLQDPARGTSRDREFIDSLPAIVYEIFEPPTDGDRAAAPDLFISSQVGDMLGYDQRTWLLKPILWRDLIHPDDLAKLNVAMSAADVGERNQLRYRMRNASGEWCWISDNQQVVERYPDGSRLVTGVFSNVTAETRTSEALNAAQARFRRLFEFGHSPMAIMQLTGEVIDINPSLERLTGYRRADVHGRSWLDFVHPDDHDESRRAMREIVEGDRVSYHIPKRIITASGAALHTRVTAMQLMSPYDDPPGDIVFALLEDVTVAREAEEQLEKSEAAIRSVIESIADAFGILDADWNIVYANEAATEMSGTGLRPEDVIGRNMWELLPPEPRTQWVSLLRAVARTRQPAEAEFEFPDEHWVLLRAFPTADGGMSVFARDVTARHREQRELRESEERYRTLVDISPFAIAVHSGGKIVFVNPAAVKMMGARSAAELIGRDAMSFVAPASRELAAERIRMMMATGEAQAPTPDEHFVRLDGTEFPVEVSASPLTWEGRPAFLIVGRDVSDRVTLEAQFRQAQKMEVVGRLAGGMAHDFSNLNTAIRGYAELIADQLPADSEPAEAARVIVSATERTSDLIRRLLTFSRHSPGVFAPTDLGLVATRLRPLLERTIAEDIDFDLAVAPDLPPVLIDASQFEHVLLNLVVNARDAMPEGGRLQVSIAPFGGVPAGGEPGQSYLLVTVSDTGVGMRPDVRERATDPFFTTKGPGEGTGLGLALVYGIVSGAGGVLDINSMPGRGTRIHIFLPVAAGVVATSPARPARPAPVSATTAARLLLVEDDPHVRDVAVRALSKAGYRADSAPDPASAMATYGDECGEFDLLITDVVMPGSSGRDLAEQVREHCPQIKVLFMSGYTEEQLARRGVSHTGTGFLAKPFAPSALLEAVAKLLSGPSPGDPEG